MKLLSYAIILTSAVGVFKVAGQTVPPEAGPGASRATPLPLSGQSGGVATIQTSSGGAQSVNTISSTVQVQGAFAGSVAQGQAAGPRLELSRP